MLDDVEESTAQAAAMQQVSQSFMYVIVSYIAKEDRVIWSKTLPNPSCYFFVTHTI